MISKLRIKYLRSLQQKKYRSEHKSFVIENKKLILELLRNQADCISELYVLPGLEDELQGLAGKYELIDSRDLKSISQLSTPSGMIAACSYLHHDLASQDTMAHRRMLFLDGIQDPGNLGAIMRIADWFGVDLLVLSPDSVDPYNIKAVHSSMGSLYRVSWSIATLGDLQRCTDAPVYLTDMSGKDYRTDLPDRYILVIGNEGRGIRDSLKKGATNVVTIPRTINSRAESLNAAMSTAVILSRWS